MFVSPYTLAAATVYALVIRAVGPLPDVIHWRVNTSGIYVGGHLHTSSNGGGNWGVAYPSVDTMFEVHA